MDCVVSKNGVIIIRVPMPLDYFSVLLWMRHPSSSATTRGMLDELASL